MMNKSIMKSIFSNYHISKIIMIEEKNFYAFIIEKMNESISLDRWEQLENVLKDYTKKEISLIPYMQAYNQLGKKYLDKGVII